MDTAEKRAASWNFGRPGPVRPPDATSTQFNRAMTLGAYYVAPVIASGNNNIFMGVSL